jgi:hypothetical protein
MLYARFISCPSIDIHIYQIKHNTNNILLIKEDLLELTAWINIQIHTVT